MKERAIGIFNGGYSPVITKTTAAGASQRLATNPTYRRIIEANQLCDRVAILDNHRYCCNSVLNVKHILLYMKVMRKSSCFDRWMDASWCSLRSSKNSGNTPVL